MKAQQRLSVCMSTFTSKFLWVKNQRATSPMITNINTVKSVFMPHWRCDTLSHFYHRISMIVAHTCVHE